MEAFPSAETLAKVVKRLRVDKYNKIFKKITNVGWWSRLNLVKKSLSNSLIKFMQVELKFPAPLDVVETEQEDVESEEEIT